MNVGLDLVDQFFSYVDVESDMVDKVKSWVQEIAPTQPGAELLERLARIGRQFRIVASEQTVTFPNLHLVQIEPDTPYLYVTKKEGKKFLVEGPKSIRCAHELIHLMHAYEDSVREEERGKTCTFDDMDNEEERLTITGSNHLETDNCNENSLLAAFGLPLRENHDGVARVPPTPIDLIKVGALGTLKEILRDDPLQIDFVGHCVEAERTTSLLSAAAYFDQKEIIEYLLSSGVDTNKNDEIGGPILAALKHDHKELALSLAERGMNKDLKDAEQRTALVYLNQRPTARFDQRSKPLLKILSG